MSKENKQTDFADCFISKQAAMQIAHDLQISVRNQYVTKRDVINTLCFDCLHGDLDENRCFNYPCAEIEAVMRMPVTQPEIIRCHECKHVQNDELFVQLWCNGNRVNPDHFCGYAERRQDETNSRNKTC